MPTISVDFTNVQGFKPVPAGEYLVEVANVEVTESKSGDPMLKVQYKIAEGEYAGRTVFDNIMLDYHNKDTREQVMAYAQRDLEVLLGQEMTGKQNLSTEDLVGAQATAVVTQTVTPVEEGGSGEPQNNVARLKSANVSSAADLFN